VRALIVLSTAAPHAAARERKPKRVTPPRVRGNFEASAGRLRTRITLA
jgi:hypothetical protein